MTEPAFRRARASHDADELRITTTEALHFAAFIAAFKWPTPAAAEAARIVAFELLDGLAIDMDAMTEHLEHLADEVDKRTEGTE